VSFFKITGFRIPREGGCEITIETSEGHAGLAKIDSGLMDSKPARLIPALLGTMTEAARIAGKPPEPEPEPIPVPEKGKWIEPGGGQS
jgi:hypothetical protein